MKTIANPDADAGETGLERNIRELIFNTINLNQVDYTFYDAGEFPDCLPGLPTI